MNKIAKRRNRQKRRVLESQEYVAGLSRYEFAALMTVLDDLEEFDPGVGMVEWTREPTAWEKIKEFLFGSEDAESN